MNDLDLTNFHCVGEVTTAAGGVKEGHESNYLIDSVLVHLVAVVVGRETALRNFLNSNLNTLFVAALHWVLFHSNQAVEEDRAAFHN